MKKAIFFWLYFLLSIVLAVYFATRIITSTMGRGPISTVQDVKTYGINAKDNETIKITLGISEKTTLRSVDLYQLNNKILNIPGVKNSSVRILPNGVLAVKIEKHKVVATWTDGFYFYPLAADGTKIDKPSTEPNENTIIFQGGIPDDLTDITNSLSQISKYIDYIDMVESRRLNIYTKNGTVIYLPENNPVVAINKINTLNQTHKLLSRKLDIIDMRDASRILVKEKNETF